MTDRAADPYGYDPRTHTVRVSVHDLARLLIQFRTELERPWRPGAAPPAPSSRWTHAADYDLSFERLADAVDYARARWPLAPRGDRAPDRRMRCKRADAYEWPERAPYDGTAPEVVAVRPVSRHGTHCVTWGRAGVGRALCGLSVVAEDCKRADGPPSCRECARELELSAALGGAR